MAECSYALYKPSERSCRHQWPHLPRSSISCSRSAATLLSRNSRMNLRDASAWFSHLMPNTDNDDVFELLRNRRFVVIQGPPGTENENGAPDSRWMHTAALVVPCNSIRALPTRPSSAALPHFRTAEVKKVRSASASLRSQASFSKPPLSPQVPRSHTCSTSMKSIGRPSKDPGRSHLLVRSKSGIATRY